MKNELSELKIIGMLRLKCHYR